MEKLKPYKPIIIAISFFIIVVVSSCILSLHTSLPNIIESNFFMTLVAFIVGGLVFYLYIRQKEDNKKDAAKIILQEIRRAEDIIADFKEHGHYKLTKRIIAINSWKKNIHYFVDDLTIDELDKISDLYCRGEYLDSIIAKISDVKFDEAVDSKKIEKSFYLNKIVQEIVKKILRIVPSQQNQIQIQENLHTQESSNGQVQSEGRQSLEKEISNIINKELIPIRIVEAKEPWKGLLEDISYKYEPIYHSNICEKLKKIAKLK